MCVRASLSMWSAVQHKCVCRSVCAEKDASQCGLQRARAASGVPAGGPMRETGAARRSAAQAVVPLPLGRRAPPLVVPYAFPFTAQHSEKPSESHSTRTVGVRPFQAFPLHVGGLLLPLCLRFSSSGVMECRARARRARALVCSPSQTTASNACSLPLSRFAYDATSLCL